MLLFLTPFPEKNLPRPRILGQVRSTYYLGFFPIPTSWFLRLLRRPTPSPGRSKCNRSNVKGVSCGRIFESYTSWGKDFRAKVIMEFCAWCYPNFLQQHPNHSKRSWWTATASNSCQCFIKPFRILWRRVFNVFGGGQRRNLTVALELLKLSILSGGKLRNADTQWYRTVIQLRCACIFFF